jgi:hypothetical protein
VEEKEERECEYLRREKMDERKVEKERQEKERGRF